MTLCLCLYSRNSIRRKKNKIGALKKSDTKNTTVKITLTIKINDEIRSRIFVFRNQKQNLIVADIFKIEACLLLLSHSLSRFTPSHKKNEEKSSARCLFLHLSVKKRLCVADLAYHMCVVIEALHAFQKYFVRRRAHGHLRTPCTARRISLPLPLSPSQSSESY